MFLILFLSLPITTNLSGQVVIRERVKIEPKENFSKKRLNQVQAGYLPCGPFPQGTESLYRQVVWQGSSYPLDVRQHAFDIQDNVKMTRLNFPQGGGAHHIFKIISGADNCTIWEYFPYYGGGQEYIEPKKAEDSLMLTQFEMAGDPTERNPNFEPEFDDNGNCSNCEHQYITIQGVKTTLEFLRYRIIFDKPGTVVFEIISTLGDTVPTRFETTVIEPDYILDYISDTEIPHLEEVALNVKADIIQCGFVEDWTNPDSLLGAYDFVSYYNGGSLSLENKFNVSIIEGNEFGTLTYVDDSDPYNAYKEEGDNFSYLDDTYGLKFLANGEYPDSVSKVKIRFTTTGPSNVTPIDVEIPIIENPNYPIKVNIEPNTLLAGDTAVITLEKRTSEDWYDEPMYGTFEDEQEFNVSIIKGGELGRLYSGYEGNKSDEFLYITQEELLFIADTNVTIDEILIKVSTEIGDEQWDPLSNNKKGKRKKRGNSVQGIAPPTGGATIYGIGMIKGGMEIMLGETKYFALKKKEDKTEIAEIPTEYGVKPEWTTLTDDWQWKKNSSVWGENPIEFLGEKSGVYWEDKWFKSSDNSNQPLPAGMIRIIGRYWEDGKENDFKVKLKDTDKAEISIKVIKPGKLLTEGQTPTYEKARDVSDNEYSVDELCIEYGGKYGIPPQMLKGQMFTESAKKNFGGTTGWGFAPSYRYEPYTVQLWKSMHEIISEDINPFLVSENSMGKTGSASVPTTSEHNHVKFNHYFETPKTVWDIIEENSRLVDINNESTIYGFQYAGTGADSRKKGEIKSGAYTIVGKTYNLFLKGGKIDGGELEGYKNFVIEKYKLDKNDELSLEQQIEANDSARVATIRYLKNDYKGGGLDNIFAQTRIASSYGLLQILYLSALDMNYETSNDDRPENLNELSSLDYSIKFMKYKFKNFNKFSLSEKLDNWESKFSGKTTGKGAKFPKPVAGFEEALKVMLYSWNSGLQAGGKAVYHTHVLNNLKKFLPRRK